MKKRLSLLMVLMMVVSLLPLSAFAAANVVYTTQNVEASTEDTSAQHKDVVFNLRFPEGSVIRQGAFRLELSNGAEFRTGTTLNGVGSISLTGVNPVGNILFAQINGGDTTNAPAGQGITVSAKVYAPNVGDVTVKVVDDGNTGIGNLAEVKIINVTEAATEDVSITVKDSSKSMSFDGGELSQFEVRNLKGVTAGRSLILSVANDRMKFGDSTTVLVDGSNVATPVNAQGKIVLTHAQLNGKKSVIVTPKFAGLSGKVEEGNVVVDAIVSADATPDKAIVSNSATIGKIVPFDVVLEVVEKGKKEIPSVWGGEETTLKVTLKGPIGSLDNREVSFKINGANVYLNGITAAVGGAISVSGDPERVDAPATPKFFKDGEFDVRFTNPHQQKEVAFFVKVKTDSDKDGVATIKASQRGWSKEADIAKITPKFQVETTVNQVKKGERKETSTVVVKEAKAGLLKRGDIISLKFKARRNYVEFANKTDKVEATNGLRLELDNIKLTSNNTELQYRVTRTSSKDPAEITFKEIKVLIDGSATDEDVKIYGLLNGDDVDSERYIAVVKEYALGAQKSEFTVGQTTYKVDNKENTLQVAPYVKNGRVMLPIRAVAEALGLRVEWNPATKTATFSDATKTAAVVIGAEVIHVNGTPVRLSAKAELVQGTTFVELRSLSSAFGVDIKWEPATKTAVVSR